MAAALGVVAFLYAAQAGLRYWLRSDLPDDAPRIGLSLDGFFVNQSGVTAAAFDQGLARVGLRMVEIPRDAAGEPFDRDAIARLVGDLDGIVIGGGGDIRAEAYGGDDSVTSMVDPSADDLQLALVHEARRQRVPVLGICRGLQILNVAHGGSLRRLRGEASSRHYLAEHPLYFASGTELLEAVGRDRLPRAASTHRFAIAEIGQGLRPIAWADATHEEIEAIELTAGDGWVLGVMWHPERESLRSPEGLGPFRALAAAVGSGGARSGP